MSNNCLTLTLTSFITLAVFFGLYASSASVVFALYYQCQEVGTQVKCCAYIKGRAWCTICDNTQPPSNCGPRYPPNGITDGGNGPPTNLAPPKVCPDGSSPDASGVCPPVTQGTPPPPPPKGATGTIEQPPSNLASQPKTSQRAFSPTGGCVPGGTTCIPCDPGLATHGANCIPSGDWRPGSSGLGTELGGGSSSTPPTTVQPPPAQGAVTEQPPANLAPPKVCPDGSSPDANGQCPPTPTTGNQNPQSLTNNNNNNNNNGGSNGNSNTNNNNGNNNLLSQQQNNKGSNLLGHAGELTGKKKGSSPTPPPCPTDNSPIPPNCTLKPKI